MSETFGLLPRDEHDERLLANVHPTDWKNPKPAKRYNLVVLGAGTAGLVTALGAAGLGAKVALVEERLTGGDCLNFGCVPSKSLISAARAAADSRRADRFGVQAGSPVEIDFGAAMARMRQARAKLSWNDSVARCQSLGVDVFLGHARFVTPTAVDVGGETLRYRNAVIATGSRPAWPEIPGLDAAGALTNETVFSLTARPRRLLVVGGGPIGCELAQAFQRLGVAVTLVHAHERLLDREDPEASALIQKVFVAEGLRVILGAQVLEAGHDRGTKTLRLTANGREETIAGDEILVGVGRAPNVTGLGLEALGIRTDERTGVIVNEYLQTSRPNIFAVGDVCLATKFTHAADASARVVVRNALFPGKLKFHPVVPRCTFTDPEIASVGAGASELKQAGIRFKTVTRALGDIDRAIVDGEENGFLAVRVASDRDQILGATLVSQHAGEMIGLITVAMVDGLGLDSLSRFIYPYPTRADIINRASLAHFTRRLTPFKKTLLARWLSWTR